jgi:hypothetical protein
LSIEQHPLFPEKEEIQTTIEPTGLIGNVKAIN